MKKRLLATLLLSVSMLAACGGDDTGNQNADGSIDGEKVVKSSCATCHGGNLEGKGNTPALNDVGARLSEAEILDVIENGRNGMPPGLIKGEEAEAAAKWLAEQK
ncbi:MAG: cytochrome c [Caryophanon sp.]|nr:cytochrome c [Caryophanon sp.]